MNEVFIILVLFFIALIGLYVMAVANDRRLRALAVLLDEHDKRLQVLERDASILNWTNDQ